MVSAREAIDAIKSHLNGEDYVDFIWRMRQRFSVIRNDLRLSEYRDRREQQDESIERLTAGTMIGVSMILFAVWAAMATVSVVQVLDLR